MKKIISVLCVVILFCGLNLQAKPVSLNQAQDIAKKILESQPATKSGSGQIRLIWDGEDVATKASQPAFYVFGRDGGGFVIIAGDDNVTPVLAISESNEFKTEGMPENVKWWMDRMKVYVRTAKIQSAEVKQQWASYVATKDASVPAGEVTVTRSRLTPEWNQRDPYNGLCPLDASSNRTITGCVALAISEILSYQAKNCSEMHITMPAKGTGTVGGYSVSTGYVAPALYELTTNYDWDVIANFNASEATDAQKNALARLIADIGAIVEARYSKDDTGASSGDVPRHMAEHFSFNKAATREMAAWYSNRQWINKLKTEIDLRPLYYFGQSSRGGHAFVFDGYGTYNTVDVFHVNFGWGGTNNGYYYYTNLDTSSSTDGSEDWSYEAGAIFGFYPDASSSYPVKLQASYWNDERPGVSVALTASSCYYIYSIFNNENTQFNGEIKFVVRKKNGDEVEYGDPYNKKNITIDPQAVISGSFGFTGGTITDIAFGDSVVCYYWNGSNWVLLDCIPGSAIAQWPLMPVSFIKTEASYSHNDWFTFELMNIDYIYPGTVWTITDKDGNVIKKKQSDYEVQLTNTGTYKIEAATAKTVGGPVVERLVTYITVN